MPEPEGRGSTALVDKTDALFEEVYARLKAMASRQRSRAGAPASLCTTEVVHELFLRMGGERALHFGNQLQFFAYAARAMRHILIDLARKRMNIKDGGDLRRVPMTDPAVASVSVEASQALELDAALRALEAESPRAAQVLELHYFAGLPLQRVAELLGVSSRTVDRDWRFACSFLSATFGPAGDD